MESNTELDKDLKTNSDENFIKDKNDEIVDSPSATTNDIPEFGWSSYAERMNGRFAMIGFIAIIIIEAVSGNSFLNWAGFIN